MTTGSAGGVPAGRLPASCTTTLARLPSAAATTICLVSRLPPLAFEHKGSMPMRMIGLAGIGPVSLICPLIVPVPAWAAAVGVASCANRTRSAATAVADRLIRRRYMTTSLFPVLLVIGIPVFAVAVFARHVERAAEFEQPLHVLLLDE